MSLSPVNIHKIYGFINFLKYPINAYTKKFKDVYLFIISIRFSVSASLAALSWHNFGKPVLSSRKKSSLVAQVRGVVPDAAPDQARIKARQGRHPPSTPPPRGSRPRRRGGAPRVARRPAVSCAQISRRHRPCACGSRGRCGSPPPPCRRGTRRSVGRRSPRSAAHRTPPSPNG